MPERAEEPLAKAPYLVAWRATAGSHQKVADIQRQRDFEGADQPTRRHITLRQYNAPEHHARAVDCRLHRELRQREPGTPLRRHCLGFRQPKPLIPGTAFAASRNRRVMDEPMLLEIIRLPERSFAFEQLRRAEGSESLREQRLRVKAGIPAVAQTDGKINLVALEVC